MGATDRPRGRGRARTTPLILLGVLAAAIGIAIGLIIDWFPTPASTQAGPIDTFWDVLIIVSVPVFVLVVAVTLYCVYAFRMRPGEELVDGPPIHGNTRLEVIWTLIPAVLILGLCTYAYFVLHDVEEAKANEMRVKVTGQQFAWTFEMPGPGGKPVRANELWLPQGQPVRFDITSPDVIHDFWVPAFRMKLDAVPGIVGHYRITPKRLGTYDVVCAELCGIAHAYMRSRVHVVPRAQYVAQMRKLAAPVAAAGGGATGGATAGGGATGGGGGNAAVLAAGKQVFQENGCGSCHVFAPAGSTGQVGPDLAKVKGDPPAEILKSIVNPNAVVEKPYQPNIMPGNFGQTIPKDKLDALVTYLKEASK